MSEKIINSNSNEFALFKDIEFFNNITKDSYAYGGVDNTFSIFKSIDNIIYLIYANEKLSIICYDLIKDQKINEIKKAHKKYITNFTYNIDEKNKRDLILSISFDDNNIKLWKVKDFECLLNIEHANDYGYLYSACFLSDSNQLYIISSNFGYSNELEPIKVFNIIGNKIKEINELKENVMYINSYYDKFLSINYIITGNNGYIISYNYSSNQLYHKYCNNDNRGHFSIIIININEEIKLIESSCDGSIRIWDFHSGILLKKVKASNSGLNGISLWNEDFLFIGCDDKYIKILDLKKMVIIKSLIGHNNEVITIKKIIHPLFGECMISQGLEKDQIKLWVNKKTFNFN